MPSLEPLSAVVGGLLVVPPLSASGSTQVSDRQVRPSTQLPSMHAQPSVPAVHSPPELAAGPEVLTGGASSKHALAASGSTRIKVTNHRIDPESSSSQDGPVTLESLLWAA